MALVADNNEIDVTAIEKLGRLRQWDVVANCHKTFPRDRQYCVDKGHASIPLSIVVG